jgi:hypothetical protein
MAGKSTRSSASRLFSGPSAGGLVRRRAIGNAIVAHLAGRSPSVSGNVLAWWAERRAERDRKIPIAGPKADKYLPPIGAVLIAKALVGPVRHVSDCWSVVDVETGEVLWERVDRSTAFSVCDAMNMPSEIRGSVSAAIAGNTEPAAQPAPTPDPVPTTPAPTGQGELSPHARALVDALAKIGTPAVKATMLQTAGIPASAWSDALSEAYRARRITRDRSRTDNVYHVLAK